jgi:hypothetical protein
LAYILFKVTFVGGPPATIELVFFDIDLVGVLIVLAHVLVLQVERHILLRYVLLVDASLDCLRGNISPETFSRL